MQATGTVHSDRRREFPPQEQGARLRRLVLYLADRAGPTEIGKVREAPAAEFFWSATG
jgi:hypothetical protein